MDSDVDEWLDEYGPLPDDTIEGSFFDVEVALALGARLYEDDEFGNTFEVTSQGRYAVQRRDERWIRIDEIAFRSPI